MAKPDCDDGWYKKSIELEAALGYADFTKLAQTILRYVFCQIFGQGKRPRYAVLNCSEIAARMKKPRQHIFRAIQELVASNALAPVLGREDAYRFIKDYEKWVMVARLKGSFHPTKVLRITPEEVADCLDAPDYSRGFVGQKHTDESVINLDDGVISIDYTANSDLSSIEMTNCHQSRLQTVIPIDDRPMHTDQTTSKNGEYVTSLSGNDLHESLDDGTKFPFNSNTENTEKRERESIRPYLSKGNFRGIDPHAPGSPSAGNPDPFQANDPPGIPPDPEAAAPKLDRYERSLRKYVVEKTTSADLPGGNDDLVEFALKQFAMWRGQDYPVEAIKSAIKAATDAIGFGNSLAWSKWVTKRLGGFAADNASLARAPARPKVRDDDYYVAPETTQFTNPPRTKP